MCETRFQSLPSSPNSGFHSFRSLRVQGTLSDSLQQLASHRSLWIIDAFVGSALKRCVASQSRSLIDDACFVSRVRMFAGLHDEAIGAACSTTDGVVRREVGHRDIAVGIFFCEDHPEVASFVEAKERVARVHEARA